MNKGILHLLIIISILIIPNVISAEDSTNESSAEIDIQLHPREVLFDIHNMKPGDWAPRTIVVKNVGIKDFTYQMSVENKGDNKLYNELLLDISDRNEELFKGKLSDFSNLPHRSLSTANQEKLKITVKMPEHIGNEFQGTDSQFHFIFTAEGKEISGHKDEESVIGTLGTSQSGGAYSPGTASIMFNYLLIGFLLIFAVCIMVGVNYFHKNRSWNGKV